MTRNPMELVVTFVVVTVVAASGVFFLQKSFVENRSQERSGRPAPSIVNSGQADTQAPEAMVGRTS